MVKSEKESYKQVVLSIRLTKRERFKSHNSYDLVSQELYDR